MNPKLRVFLVCLGLMAAPMVPSWVAGGREGTGVVVMLTSALLFTGAVLVGWWFIQREIREHETDEP